MTVCVLPNPKKTAAVEPAQKAAGLLHYYGARVVIPEQYRDLCPVSCAEYLPQDDAFEAANVLLTVGGDGTILHAAKASLKQNKPILGVNLGRTGFLATCEVSEMEDKLYRMVKGDYKLDSRIMLEAEGEGIDGPWKCTSLNDIVVTRIDPLHTIDCVVLCDGIDVNNCRGDGVIVATPTGSTAYAMSAGGPILDASIEGFVVTPICAHSLHNPPMVFSAQRHITIQIDENGHGAWIISDGAQQMSVLPGTPVRVQLSPQRMQLVTFNKADQFQAIDQKLKGR